MEVELKKERLVQIVNQNWTYNDNWRVTDVEFSWAILACDCSRNNDKRAKKGCYGCHSDNILFCKISSV